MKRCTVAYATPERQWLWSVELPDDATVADAVAAARNQGGGADVSWDADVGIFGELCEPAAIPRNGDRIELYRALRSDPKERRRARVAAARAAAGPASARTRSSTPKKAR